MTYHRTSMSKSQNKVDKHFSEWSNSACFYSCQLLMFTELRDVMRTHWSTTSPCIEVTRMQKVKFNSGDARSLGFLWNVALSWTQCNSLRKENKLINRKDYGYAKVLVKFVRAHVQWVLDRKQNLAEQICWQKLIHSISLDVCTWSEILVAGNPEPLRPSWGF